MHAAKVQRFTLRGLGLAGFALATGVACGHHDGPSSVRAPGLQVAHEHREPLAASTVEPGPSVALGVEHLGKPEECLRIHSLAQGPASDLMTWKMRVPAGLADPEVVVRDDRGRVAVDVERVHEVWTLKLGRAPRGPVQVHAVFGRAESPSLQTGLSCTEVSATLAGEVVPLPEALLAQPVAVALDVTHPSRPDYKVATSLGLGPHHQVTLRGPEIRRLNMLVGDLGVAKLETSVGRDEVAAMGYTAFDMRWVAAETAGVRSAVDSTIGLVSDLAFSVLMVSDFRSGEDRSPKVFLRTASLWLGLDAGESWGPEPRLQVAQTLVSRWLGGQVWVAATDEPALWGQWLHLGFSRYIAREILFSLGTVDVPEYLDDLHRGEAQAATSRYRGQARVSLPGAGATPRARRDAALEMMIRGEQAAAYLDEQLRQRGSGLPALASALLLAARKHKRRRVDASVWTAVLEQHLGAAQAAVFWQIIEGKVSPSLHYGPCFRAKKFRYERFDLGFTAPKTGDKEAAGVGVIEEVDPLGPAAQAGLLPGDTLVKLDVPARDPRRVVSVEIRRAGEPLELRYRPLGGAGWGKRWMGKSNIDPGLCPRWSL